MKMIFARIFPLLAMVLAVLCLNTSASAAPSNGKETIKPYHQAVMKDCATCHGAKTPTADKPFLVPDDSVCKACHGSYDSIAAKTEPKSKKDDPNPHRSAHYGYELSCTACHKQHEPTEVYCNNCHEFHYPKMKP